MTLSRLFHTLCACFAILAASMTTADAATIVVNAGSNLQSALDAAQPGDVIVLQSGVTFSGNFTLPVKSGATYITVRSDTSLPSPGTRINPAFAGSLAKIQSPNTAPALRALPGSHHWRLQLLDFPWNQLGYGEIVRLGEGSSAQSQLSQVPYEIELDRVYIHGHPLYGQKRGVALNGRAVTIRNSYISEIKAVGVDTQAIGGWNGPGPFVIENNYLEGTGENFLLGGSDPAIPNLVSEDVIVRRNYMFKPMAWRAPIIPTPTPVFAVETAGAGSLSAGSYTYRVVARRPVGGGTTGRSAASAPATAMVLATGSVSISWPAVPDATEYRVYGRGDQYWTVSTTSFNDTGAAGTPGAAPEGPGDTWQVKNIFELKNARRVTVEYNIFENNWANAQPGYAILFTPRNQDGACNWCVVEQVTFQFNIVRTSASGINLSGYDYPNTSAQTNRITIRQNLFHGITQTLGGAGWFLLMGDEPREIAVDHNTINADGTAIVYAYGGTASAPRTIAGFQFTNNAARHNDYGINGANTAWGNGTIAAYFPGGVVAGNWLQGGTASRYPSGNSYGGSFEAAFASVATADYRPAAGSVLLGGSTDGAPIGADIGTLLVGTQGVIDGTPGLRPSPPSNLRIITVPR